jgi:hypothetical protein
MYKAKNKITLRTSAIFIEKGQEFGDGHAEAMIKKHSILKDVLTKKSK